MWHRWSAKIARSSAKKVLMHNTFLLRKRCKHYMAKLVTRNTLKVTCGNVEIQNFFREDPRNPTSRGGTKFIDLQSHKPTITPAHVSR